jgi:hypothetical protein
MDWITIMRLGLAAGMLVLAGCGIAPKAPGPGEALLGQIESSHGPEARQRVEAWRDLVEREQSVAEGEKLRSVNAFINRLVFVDDAVHWGREDYWATPLETLVSNGGDCEDFTIAKYYTLRSLRQRARSEYVGDRDQVGLWREFLARLQREERDWATLSPFLGSANAAE